MPPPIVTVSLYGFAKSERLWALTQMGFARPAVARARGLRFWKLLGSGHGGGFSLTPNWRRYGLLAVWESADAAEAFHANSAVVHDYRAHAAETWTVRLVPTSAHGLWSGTNPFTPVEPPTGDPLSSAPVAVLTRGPVASEGTWDGRDPLEGLL